MAAQGLEDVCLSQGKGKYLWSNGHYYEGDWEEDQMHGEGARSSERHESVSIVLRPMAGPRVLASWASTKTT